MEKKQIDLSVMVWLDSRLIDIFGDRALREKFLADLS